MATSDNFEGSLAMVAPAGGTTVGTLVYNSTTKAVVLPMTVATSGNTYTAKVAGRVNGSPKSTVAAWVIGQSLRWTSTKWAIATATSHVSQATAAATGTAGATTGDVILRFPVRGVA